MGRWIPVNGIVAVSGRRNAVPLLNRGLKALAARARIGFVAVSDTAALAHAAARFSFEATSVIGGCLVGHARPQPNQGLLHGRVYQSERLLSRLFSYVRSAPLREKHRAGRFDGEFCAAQVYRHGLGIVRDPLGTRPLFAARDSGVIAFASEQSALHAMGFATVHPVLPGYASYVDSAISSALRYHEFPGGELEITTPEAAQRLVTLLRRAVRERIRPHRRVALAFSGGLDSTVLARILAREGKLVALSVSVRGAKDEAGAQNAASLLNIPLRAITLRRTDIARWLRALRPHGPRTEAMDLSIAVAIAAVASEARQQGCTALVLGQLADELFGGYRKYLALAQSDGAAMAAQVMRADVLDAYETGFPRDETAAAPFTPILLPYAALPLVDFALQLPVPTKLDLVSQRRKVVLRAAAELLGVPPELARRGKQALQYSTGLLKEVQRLSPATPQNSARL